MARLIRTESFEHNGTEYEIRVMATEDGYSVRAFRENSPANHLTYSVQWDVNLDLRVERGCSAVDELISIAMADVRNNL